MLTSICLLTCALASGQLVDRGDWQLSPRLEVGQELVYTGTYTEESLVPNVHFQRQYRLEAILFALEAGKANVDLALMTSLSLQEARQAVVTAAHQTAPASVRLELARLDMQGRLRSMKNAPLPLAVLGPATLESGFLAEVPLERVDRNHSWEAGEEGRPPRFWQLVGPERCNGVTCVKLVCRQQSDNWDRPNGTQKAWRRKDTLWLSPLSNTAQKVERTIERRDPAHRLPTERAIVSYELESLFKYPGKLFDDRRREILAVKKFQDDSAPLFKQPGQYRPQIDGMIKKVSFHLDHQPETPYRKAILHLKQGLEYARKGETLVPTESEEPKVLVRPVEPGHLVSDFVVSSITDQKSVQFQKLLGKPVLVIFYNPTSTIGRDLVLYAKGLMEKHEGKLSVMAMAVTTDAEAARKQHQDLRLPFPILDGRGMRLTFGVVDTPRIVLLDGDGMVRTTHTGWGYHVPEEIARELNQRK